MVGLLGYCMILRRGGIDMANVRVYRTKYSRLEISCDNFPCFLEFGIECGFGKTRGKPNAYIMLMFVGLIVLHIWPKGNPYRPLQ